MLLDFGVFNLTATEKFKEAMLELSDLELKEMPTIKQDYNEDDKILSSDHYLILDPKLQVKLEILPFQAFLFSTVMTKIVGLMLETKLSRNSPTLSTNSSKNLIDMVLSHEESSSIVFLPSQIHLFEELRQCNNKQHRKLTIPMLLKYMDNIQKSTFNFSFKHLLTMTQKVDFVQLKTVDVKQPMPFSVMCCLLNVGSTSLSGELELDNKKNHGDKHTPQCSLPIGVFSEKKAQLQWLKSALWSNAAVLDGSALLIK